MKTGLKLLLRNRLATFGALILFLVVAVALLAPWLPLLDPDVTNPANRLLLPLSEGHLLGTDHLGRDLLSRLIWGTQLSLAVGFAAAAAAAVIGSAIGVCAGYFGGRTDNIIMRGIDTLMAFPYILLALAIVAVMGPGLMNALLAITVVNIPFFARNIRGVTVGITHREFVSAARLSGKNDWQIIVTEILPNVAPVIVIAASTTVGWMILETAGLSFLGLGSQPPQADLGSMLGDGRKLLFNAPHASIVPGLMIFVIVMSINLLGDGIRDMLDPRLRSGALSRPAAATHTDLSDEEPPTSADDDTVLSIKQLRTEFQSGDRTFKSVNGVSLSLKRGECLGIVGESGSGKSVTALSLMRLVASPPGVIVGGSCQLNIDNESAVDTLRASESQLRDLRGRRVAYIFQDPLSTLHPLYTIGEQMVEAIRCHRMMPRQKALEIAIGLLNQVQIPNAAARTKSYPHELSGGMRQRVSIALALVNDPEVIIADEPTTALDVTVQAQILKLLDQLRKERNMTVIFITHDFGVVAHICDRVAVMYAGSIVESGTTSEVLSSPMHPYTRRLMECVPKLGDGKRKLAAIHGLPPRIDQLPQGCAFADRCLKKHERCESQPVELQIHGAREVRCLFPEAV